MMNRRYCKLFWMVHPLLVYMVAFSAGLLSAQGHKLSEQLNDSVDAVLVLDASGSMRRTDPLKLRNEGAKLFTGFLKEGDRLGIISFGDTASVVSPLAPFTTSGSTQVESAIQGVGDDRQFTDIFAGLKLAGEQLAAAPRQGSQRVIVLLSDGKMDPDPAVGSATLLTDKLLNDHLPQLKADGIKVHTLALSDLADVNLLRQIAVATDGVHFVAPTAETIHKSFADLFLVVKKPQVLPLTSKGLKVDADIQEATFYINREEGKEVQLIKPNGEQLTAKTTDGSVKWFAGQKFDVITVTKPEPGDWVVLGVNPGDGFATVLTNLKLISDWPSGIYDGQSPLLQARLYDGEKPIVLPQMTGEIRYGVRITPTDKVAEPVVREFLVDDGTRGDQVARDGVFSLAIEGLAPGEYRLQVVARAPTFERSQQLPFRVRPRLVSLKVRRGEAVAESPISKDEHAHPGDEKEKSDHPGPEATNEEDAKAEPAASSSGSAGEEFVVELSDEAAQLRSIEIKLVAVGADRTRYQIPVMEQREGTQTRFIAPTSHLPKSGSYEVQATMTAVGRKGAPAREVSETIRYNYTALESDAVKVIVEAKVAEKEPEQEPASWPYMLILTILNLGMAAGAFVLLKKVATKAAAKPPTFAPITEVEETLKFLEARAAETELNLADPLFTDQSLTFTLREGSGVGPGPSTTPAPSPEPSSAEAPPAPEQSPPQEGA